MANGMIKAGMKYGSYDATIDALGKKYRTEYDTEAYKSGNESAYKFYDYATGELKASAYRSSHKKNNKNISIYDSAVINMGSYTFSTTKLNNGGVHLNKFDTIETDEYIAIDGSNGCPKDGIVQAGEITKKQHGI